MLDTFVNSSSVKLWMHEMSSHRDVLSTDFNIETSKARKQGADELPLVK